MKTSSAGIAVLHFYEGCELDAYPDPATGAEPITIGYGCTYPGLKLGTRITQDEAEAMFAKRLATEFEPGVTASLKLPVTQSQFDACVCLSFNIGLGNFKSSTLVRRFNAGDVEGASVEFLKWNRAANKKMLGLSRRRATERALFLGMTSDQSIAVGQAVL